MKNIIYPLVTILVLLSGCSKEEAQSVAFSVKELQFGEQFETAYVDIVANCSWTIDSGSDFVSVSQDSGTENASISISAWRNDEYDSREQSVVIRSEDGTSSDILKVFQQPKIGLQLANPDTIKAEGGEFQMKVNTNDNITSVEVPEWITFTSSRALTGYTYTFTAEPNKTGSPRRDAIRLRGNKTTDYVWATQDSYAPTGIEIENSDLYSFRRDASFSFSLIPEYADASKLNIESKDGCKVSISESTIHVYADDYGLQTIYFNSNGVCVDSLAYEYLPSNPFKHESTTAYLYETNIPAWEYFSEDYEVKCSNNDVVRATDNRRFEAIGIGSAYLTVKHKPSGHTVSHAVTVEPFTAYAHIAWLSENYDRTYEVSFRAQVTAHHKAILSGFMLLDPQNTLKYIKQNDGSSARFAIETPRFKFEYDRSKFNNAREALKGYKFLIEMVIDGVSYQRYVDVDINRIG